ncbi:LysR family transcriptional regulator [Pseudoduganella sp. GCM10020061]|uniref:LysR family transcriptional regulator n=1 Tax=Pseudoduganella sp. GCM10020061 TaxID=3317345 RepID=UPI00363C60F6
MTFTQLEIFSLVAELQGFTAAALRLGISQSAVSHAVKSLEKELGVPLIVRHQSSVEVTEVGKRLLTRAREILGLAEAMQQEVAAARGLRQGLVRIGSFGPTSSLKLLPAILHAFRAKYPGVEVQIDEGSDNEVKQWIQDRRVDIGFVVLPNESFDTVPLVEDEMVAIVPAAHPLADKSTVTASDLHALPFIMSDTGCGALVEPAFVKAGLTLRVRYRISQVMTILGMVQAGDGVAVMPELALPGDLDCAYPRLKTVAFRPAIRRRVGLGMRDLSRAAPAVQAFVDTARQVARR